MLRALVKQRSGYSQPALGPLFRFFTVWPRTLEALEILHHSFCLTFFCDIVTKLEMIMEHSLVSRV